MIIGTVRITNRLSAATLIATSTALTVALSLVPRISSAVTSTVMITAGRLMNPPASPPFRKEPMVTSGPTVSACGICIPMASNRPTMCPDQPTATALAPSAYSRISAQPTSQATISPITA